MTEEDTISKLIDAGIKFLQAIVGTLLYYAHVVNNKILVCLNAIGAQQAAATKQTAAVINQLLDHVATYPNYGITYCASDMVLAAYSDAWLNKESKARGRTGDLTFLSENTRTPKWNGAVLMISQIINF